MPSIATNLAAVRERLKQAALRADRDPASIGLVAVSKFHSQEAVREALAAGQRLFGENRVQEAKSKYPQLRAAYPDLELHLIGPLQTNKADDAVKVFDVIETVDRPEIAVALAKAMRKWNRRLPCFIEVNTGDEPQKAGIAPAQLGDFLRRCRDDHGLSITGLMCIPPLDQDPQRYFAELRSLAEVHQLPNLSMGMSADFEAAIREGATEIRIGAALFGARAKS